MDRNAWNSRFFEFIQNASMPGRPFVYYIDRSLLMRLSGISDEDEALRDFCMAFSSSAAKDVLSRAAERAAMWELKERQDVPPFLAELALSVLAVTETIRRGSASVYRTLNQMLGLDDLEATTTPGYDAHIPDLWRKYNSFWSVQVGFVPTAKPLGRFTYQGWARSQGLVSLSDRTRILIPFIKAYEGTWEVNEVVRGLLQFLRLHQDEPVVGIINAVAAEPAEHELIFSILNSVRLGMSSQMLLGPASVRELPGLIRVDDLELDSRFAFSVLCSLEPSLWEELKGADENEGEKLRFHWNYFLEVYLDPEDFDLLRSGGGLDLSDGIRIVVKGKQARGFVRSRQYGGLVETFVDENEESTHFWVQEELGPKEAHPESHLLATIDGLVWALPTQQLRDLHHTVKGRVLVPRPRLHGGLKAGAQGNAYLNGRFPILFPVEGATDETWVNGQSFSLGPEGLPLSRMFPDATNLQVSIGKANFHLRSVGFADQPSRGSNGVAEGFDIGGRYSTHTSSVSPNVDPELVKGIPVEPGDTFVVIDASGHGRFVRFTQEIFAIRSFGISNLRLRSSYFLDQVGNGTLLVKRSAKGIFEIWPLRRRETHGETSLETEANSWLKAFAPQLVLAKRHGPSKAVVSELERFLERLADSRRAVSSSVDASKFQVQMPLLGALDEAKDLENPYDELLAFISDRGELSESAVVSAWETLSRDTMVQHTDPHDVLNLLVGLGHISRTESRVRIADPTLVPLERFTGFTLVGFRTPGFMEILRGNLEISEAVSEMALDMSSKIIRNLDVTGRWRGPSTIFVELDSAELEALTEGFKELGVSVIGELPSQRVRRLYTWETFVKNNESRARGLPEGKSKYVTLQRVGAGRNFEITFDDRPQKDRERVRVLQSENKPWKWFAERPTGHLPVTREIACWGAIQRDSHIVRRDTSRLYVRRPNFIPAHFLTTLQSATGLPPRQVNEDEKTKLRLHGVWDVYERIPVNFLEIWMERVGLKDDADA